MAVIWDIWKHGHAPFKHIGSDTIILATPKGNLLWTCDASVVEQIFMQHGKTQIPVEMVKFYDLWGPTLGSVEGREWRKHRRIVTAGFNPLTNAAVWNKTAEQVQLLLDHLLATQSSKISVMKAWTSRLALHVIAGVFFDKHLDWKEYTGKSTPTGKHKISFEEALFTIVARMGFLFMFPKSLLRILPFKQLRQAGVAYDEWTGYIKDLRVSAEGRLGSIIEKKHKKILESVVLAGINDGVKEGEAPLSEESVLGNIFFLLFTGHETTGNTMAFIMLLLAIHPDVQRKVQAELERHFAERLHQTDQWSVEQDYAALQGGIIGAVQKEVLRLYAVVQFIPRLAVSPTTVVDSKGVSHVIPADTLCLLNFPAAFRNEEKWTDPKVSVSEDAPESLRRSPALLFDPGRWLRHDATEKAEVVPECYFPFGIGPRSCPGKAFAQTEMTAAMATIFSKYSLELEVDETVVRDCQGDRRKAWEVTRNRSAQMLYEGIESNVNIMLLKDLPVRLVARGQETTF